jgi:hypothetical protein
VKLGHIYVECRDVHVKFLFGNISHFQICFLNKESICTRDQMCISHCMTPSLSNEDLCQRSRIQHRSEGDHALFSYRITTILWWQLGNGWELNYQMCQALCCWYGFGPEYLRAPNAQHTARLLEMNVVNGFLGMLGSINLHTLEVEELLYSMSWHAMDSSRDTRTQPPFLKPWPIMRHQFGMFFLECDIFAMILMSFKDH